MSEEFIDKDLGRVAILRNVRAKRVIARRKPGYIQLTVPNRFSMTQISDIFREMKPRLEFLPEKPEVKFTADSLFRTLSFSLRIEKRSVARHYMSLKDGVLYIVCPQDTDLEDAEVQAMIRNCIEQAMRHEAKRLFGAKLTALAKQYNFMFTGLKINKSRSRWGSCSSKKAINLSYFCCLLPEYLIDFVMLHELCHTVEMNHGERFWQLLDSVTDGRAKLLTGELNKCRIGW